MIQIYTNSDFLTEEYRRRVFPLLFDLCYLKNEAVKYFEITTNLSNADLAIFPIDVNYLWDNNKRHMVEDFIAVSKSCQVPVWVYSAGDFGMTFMDDVVTFRLGGFHSKLNSNTFVLPSFVNDPYEKLLSMPFSPLPKLVLPTVGFVGNADGSYSKWLKELILFVKQNFKRILKKDSTDFQSFFPSSRIRFQLLEKLKMNKQIETNFIYRNQYRAGANTEAEIINTTKEFYENIAANVYTFCIRGSGNFSVRFYETLMMGRIPLLIDTDCRLPLESQIDWKQHCILTDKTNFIKQLIDFHHTHSDLELRAIQESNRKLALEKLNRIAYFRAIAEKIIQN